MSSDKKPKTESTLDQFLEKGSAVDTNADISDDEEETEQKKVPQKLSEMDQSDLLKMVSKMSKDEKMAFLESMAKEKNNLGRNSNDFRNLTKKEQLRIKLRERKNQLQLKNCRISKDALKSRYGKLISGGKENDDGNESEKETKKETSTEVTADVGTTDKKKTKKKKKKIPAAMKLKQAKGSEA